MTLPAEGVVDVWVGRRRPNFVRDVLAGYLGSEPEIEVGLHGRPALRSGELQFNLSHSQGLAAVAVSAVHAVGVDVERPRPRLDPLRFAERFLAPAEAAALTALPAAERPEALVQLWTAKEAYLKALGTGLTVPPRSFTIDGTSVVSTHDASPPADWSLATLELPTEHYGSVALRGPLCELRLVSA